MKDLFEIIVDDEKLDPNFRVVANLQTAEPVRKIMNEIFNKHDIFDKEFIRHFQSINFNSRLWELYLVALFDSLGFKVENSPKERPDFKIEKEGKVFFVEAVCSNPNPESEEAKEPLWNSFSREDFESYVIRIGSALYSKLKKKYWELDWVKSHPVIFAIEPFHSSNALNVPDTEVINYLYGIGFTHHYDEKGNLVVENHELTEHTSGEKTIPSGYFKQDDAENISAILFSNSATYGKFNRMGFQKGYGEGTSIHTMFYQGTCYNHDPNADTALPFYFEIGKEKFIDEWRFGTSLFHNPNANKKIDKELFEGITQGFYNDGVFGSWMSNFHPFVSKNWTLDTFKDKSKLEEIKPYTKPIDFEKLEKELEEEYGMKFKGKKQPRTMCKTLIASIRRLLRLH